MAVKYEMAEKTYSVLHYDDLSVCRGNLVNCPVPEGWEKNTDYALLIHRQGTKPSATPRITFIREENVFKESPASGLTD